MIIGISNSNPVRAIVSIFVAFALAIGLTCAQTRLASAATNDDSLSLEIQYQSPVHCGQNITFTMIGKGGSGTYRYMPYSIYLKTGTRYDYQVVDLSYENFTNNNTFTFNFFINGDYQVRMAVQDAQTYKYVRSEVYFSINDVGYPTLAQWQKQADDKAEAVWQECRAKNFRSEYEKALWLHDWIINNSVYDYSYRQSKYYFVFNDIGNNEGGKGAGTCEAFHAAYMLLLNKAGIQCGRISDSGHVWTSVKVDGQWCYIDTTKDNAKMYSSYKITEDELKHLYFGLNDNIINQVLAVNNQSVKVKDPSVAATSLENNYLIKNGNIKKYSDPVVSSVQSNLDANRSSFSVQVPLASMNFPIQKVILYNLVAYDLANRNWSNLANNKVLNVSYADNYLQFKVADKGNSNDSTDQTEPTDPATPDTPSSSSIQMYRLYDPNSGEHLFTGSLNESNVLRSIGWIYEGVAWTAPAKSDTPVYRLYNPVNGDHHYTTDAHERDVLTTGDWRYEGIGWYSADTGGKKLYRLFNPYITGAGSHHYTLDAHERDVLSAGDWIYEGTCWSGL